MDHDGVRVMIDVQFRRQLPGLLLDIAFTAPAQGLTALFGRSGSGKTSIVQAIAGGLRPDSGRIVIDGRVYFDHSAGLDLPVHLRRVGYVFQDSRLFPHLSVRGNLLFGFKRAAGERKFRLDGVVELLGIGHLLDRRPHHLSGGERQRVTIGRALLAQPSLLLMDEPLSSLDPPRKSELLAYIEGVRDEMQVPILYISHEFNEVVRLADHLVLVDGGSVIRSGSLMEVASESGIAPLIGRFEAGSIIECRIAAHDDGMALSTLSFAGGQLRVPRVDLDEGTRVRVRIRSRDVAIALSPPLDVSITNQLMGTVLALTAREGPYLDCAIDVGGVTVRALITRDSSARLRLQPGMTVWALIKTVAFDSRSVGFMRRPRPSSENA
jgi:molybdate transport system ATP-binding protein